MILILNPNLRDLNHFFGTLRLTANGQTEI